MATVAVDRPGSRLKKAPSLAVKNGMARAAASASLDAHQNHLLGGLPAADYERVASHLELTPMNLGDVLYESGDKLQHVYFPTKCIIPLLYIMDDGASAEIAIVGNEGILGISLFMGGNTTPSRAIVQSAGHAFRLRADLLKHEFARPTRRRGRSKVIVAATMPTNLLQRLALRGDV